VKNLQIGDATLVTTMVGLGKESSRVRVVKAEDSLPRGPGFKPPLWRPFLRHHSFGSNLVTKIVENSNSNSNGSLR
jgi:hypothetical protein